MAVLAAACTAPTSPSAADEALCREAVAHVEACTGEPAAPAECDPTAAATVVDMSCDELGDAKADGFFSWLLCTLGFDSYCEGGGGDEPQPATRMFYGSVQRLDTLTGVRGLYVRLRRGDELKTTITGADGVFAFGGLDPAEYEIEVWYGLVRLPTVGEQTIDVSERSSGIIYVAFVP